jgi:beta-glucosidase
MVLLKNEGGLLPLDKARTKAVLVAGPDAYPGVPVGGGSAGVKPFHLVSLLEGMGAEMGTAGTVLYDRGLPTLTQVARETDFMTEASGGKPGIKVEMFSNKELSGNPVSSTVARHIDSAGVTWETMMDTMDIAALMGTMEQRHESSRRWTGYYKAAEAGRYIIALQGPREGAGSRLYVDDKLVFDNWRLLRALQPSETLELTAGPHKVVVEDFQGSRVGGTLRVGIVAENKIVSAKAKAMAAKADAVVISVGYESDSESEGGDRTFELPFGQAELIREMAAANKKTIVAVTSGGNVASADWVGSVPAYVEAWYGGQEGGKALAEVLFGEVNPSGKLPATFEAKAEDNPTFANYSPEGDSIKVEYKEGVFVGYRGYEKNHVKPLFPFGYGLSYTTFKFSKLTVAGNGAKATVSFDVTNTGKRAGAEVAEVYVLDDHAKVARPAKELKGFEKVTLAPGETKHVSVALDERAFAYYDADAKKWTIAPGKFGVMVGDSSEALDLKGSVEISAAAATGAEF